MEKSQSIIKVKIARPFAILLIILGAFMCLLDTTIVDITIPHMMTSFRVNYDSIQWVIISYMIASAVAMPLAPWIAKKIGLKNTYILGIALFTLMSAACGIAPNLETMLIARTFQGFGEGILVPIALSMLYNIFPPDQKGKATGVFAIGAITGPALGPTLGGYISEYFNWRWIFYINIPIGIFTIYFVSLFIDEVKRKIKDKLDFDFIGAISFCIFLVSFLIALSKGNTWGWTSLKTLIFFSIAYIFTLIFFIWECFRIKRKRIPFINLKLFIDYPVFGLSMIAALFFGMAIYSTYFMLPLLLEKLLKFPTLTAGEILLFPALASGVGAVLTGFLGDKFKIQKQLAIFAGIMVILGNLLLTKINFGLTKWQIVLYLLPWGFSMGMIFASLTPLALAPFHGENIKEPTALQSLIRLVGGSIGTAVATTYFTRMHLHHFRHLNEFVDTSKSIYNVLLFRMKLLFSHLSQKIFKLLLYFELNKKAYLFSFWDVFILSAFFGVIILIFIILAAIKSKNIKEKQFGGY